MNKKCTTVSYNTIKQSQKYPEISLNRQIRVRIITTITMYIVYMHFGRYRQL